MYASMRMLLHVRLSAFLNKGPHRRCWLEAAASPLHSPEFLLRGAARRARARTLLWSKLNAAAALTFSIGNDSDGPIDRSVEVRVGIRTDMCIDMQHGHGQLGM